jgi:hypothetical protein
VATANASPAKRKKVSLLECALASSGRAKSDRDRTQLVVSKPCCFLRFAEGILLLLGPCSAQSTALEEDDKVVRKKNKRCGRADRSAAETHAGCDAGVAEWSVRDCFPALRRPNRYAELDLQVGCCPPHHAVADAVAASSCSTDEKFEKWRMPFFV